MGTVRVCQRYSTNQNTPYFTMQLLFPLAVVLFVFVSCSEGNNITCYECDSDDADWCIDNLDDNDVPQVTCDTGRCAWFISKNNSEYEYVTRGCGPGTDNVGCIHGEEDGIEGQACVCDSDLCNDSKDFL